MRRVLPQACREPDAICVHLVVEGVVVAPVLMPAQRLRLMDDLAAVEDDPREQRSVLAASGGRTRPEGRIESTGREERGASERHAVAPAEDVAPIWIQEAVGTVFGEVVADLVHALLQPVVELVPLLRRRRQLPWQHHAGHGIDAFVVEWCQEAAQPGSIDDHVVVGEGDEARGGGRGCPRVAGNRCARPGFGEIPDRSEPGHSGDELARAVARAVVDDDDLKVLTAHAYERMEDSLQGVQAPDGRDHDGRSPLGSAWCQFGAVVSGQTSEQIAGSGRRGMASAAREVQKDPFPAGIPNRLGQLPGRLCRRRRLHPDEPQRLPVQTDEHELIDVVRIVTRIEHDPRRSTEVEQPDGGGSRMDERFEREVDARGLSGVQGRRSNGVRARTMTHVSVAEANPPSGCGACVISRCGGAPSASSTAPRRGV